MHKKITMKVKKFHKLDKNHQIEGKKNNNHEERKRINRVMALKYCKQKITAKHRNGNQKL